jgi:hypothetical protein
MQPIDNSRLVRRRSALLVLLFGSWATLLMAVQAAVPIPQVIVGNNSYSNVVIREIADRSVTIAHTRGMATLNLDKMTRKEKEDLGLLAPEPEPQPQTNAPLSAINFRGFRAEDREATIAAIKEFATRLKSPGALRETLQNLPPLRAKDLIAPIASYLLLSMCFVVICAKSGKPSPLLGWVPVVQMYPLYRAANMSPFWFVAALLNVFLQLTFVSVALTRGLQERALMIGGVAFLFLASINLVGWIIWCFKIAKARGKSALTGFCLLLPVTNLLALAYLTFSGSTSSAPLPKVAPATVGLRLV